MRRCDEEITFLNLIYDLDICEVMKEPVLNDNRTVSDTLYVRGLSKRITDEELTSQILNVIESPVEVDLHSKRSSGMIWARYSSIAVAQRTMIIIHQNIWWDPDLKHFVFVSQ